MNRYKGKHRKAQQIYVRKEEQANAVETSPEKRSEQSRSVVKDGKSSAVKRTQQAQHAGGGKDGTPAVVTRNQHAHHHAGVEKDGTAAAARARRNHHANHAVVDDGKSLPGKRREQAHYVVKDGKSTSAKRREQAHYVVKDGKSTSAKRGEQAPYSGLKDGKSLPSKRREQAHYVVKDGKSLPARHGEVHAHFSSVGKDGKSIPATHGGEQAHHVGKDGKSIPAPRDGEQAHHVGSDGKSLPATHSREQTHHAGKGGQRTSATHAGERAHDFLRAQDAVKSGAAHHGEPANTLVTGRSCGVPTCPEVVTSSIALSEPACVPDVPQQTRDEVLPVPKRATLASEVSTVDPERSSEDGFTSDSDLEIKEDPIDDTDLVNIIEQIQPNEHQQNLYKDAINDTRRLCIDIFDSTAYKAEARKLDFHYDGVYKVTPFGSYRQRTNIVGSDCDIVLVLHCGSSSRDCYVKHLEQLQQAVGSTQRFEFLSLIPAKVPVLKLMYSGRNGQLPLDITIVKPSEFHPYTRDHVVTEHLKAFCKLQGFTRLVKHWAKEVRMNSAQHGSLNSASWVFLVLTYLKCIGMSNANLMSIKDLLAGFFGFMCDLGAYAVPTINVLWGTVVPTWPPPPDACIVITDPCTGHNCAQALTPQSWSYILVLCERARGQVSGAACGGKSGCESDVHRSDVHRRLFGPFPDMPPFPPSNFPDALDDHHNRSTTIPEQHNTMKEQPRGESIDGQTNQLQSSVGTTDDSLVPHQNSFQVTGVRGDNAHVDSADAVNIVSKANAWVGERNRRHSTTAAENPSQANARVSERNRRHSTTAVEIPSQANAWVRERNRRHSSAAVGTPSQVNLWVGAQNRCHSMVRVEILSHIHLRVDQRNRRYSAASVEIPSQANAQVRKRIRRYSTAFLETPSQANAWVSERNHHDFSKAVQIPRRQITR